MPFFFLNFSLKFSINPIRADYVGTRLASSFFYLKILNKIRFYPRKVLILSHKYSIKSIRADYVGTRLASSFLFYLKILNKTVLSSKSINFISQILNKIDPCGLRGYKARLLNFLLKCQKQQGVLSGNQTSILMKFEWRSTSHSSPDKPNR